MTPVINQFEQTAVTFNSTATSRTITGLINGRQYQFSVAASTATGTGVPSQLSAPIWVGQPAQPGPVVAQPGRRPAGS